VSDPGNRWPGRMWAVLIAVAVLALLSGCVVGEPVALPLPETRATVAGPQPTNAPTPVPHPSPTSSSRDDGLSEAEARTLGSLQKADDFPLYTMHYQGDYSRATPPLTGKNSVAPQVMPAAPAWACSLFAALGDNQNALYGRNFDWDYSPAVLLFTDPPDGYASVSMVDIAYLGFGGERAQTLPDLALSERVGLLDAPFWPFDGMNDQGVVVGMAAVPAGQMQSDPDMETIGSLGVIREMLDHAGNVDEAVGILRSYNIDFRGGPDLHYLVADRSGRAALVEFYEGEMVVTSNDAAWHLATNFLRAQAGSSAEGACWRYDKLGKRLAEASGRLDGQTAMALLSEVSQPGTQWSIVYSLASGEVHVAMGREYTSPHTFQLDPGSE
jgi:hypothetical protein